MFPAPRVPAVIFPASRFPSVTFPASLGPSLLIRLVAGVEVTIGWPTVVAGALAYGVLPSAGLVGSSGAGLREPVLAWPRAVQAAASPLILRLSCPPSIPSLLVRSSGGSLERINSVSLINDSQSSRWQFRSRSRSSKR